MNEDLIREQLAKQRQIAVLWSVDDVLELRPDLSTDQAWKVLQQAEEHHDAEIGIHWNLLTQIAEGLYGDASETHQPEKE